MPTHLETQYALIRSSRKVVLNFIETQVGDDLNTPVPAFDSNTIRYLLVHNVNTYFHWLCFFAMKTPIDFLDDHAFTSVALIRRQFAEVDQLVAKFLEIFENQLEIPISGTISRNRHVSASPLQLFTHVITHEFHHKGQMMTMCRTLGYLPPDTDVVRC